MVVLTRKDRIMKKVAMMLGDGFEPVEAVAPVDVLRRGGAEVVLVSVMGRLEVRGAQDVTVKADALIEDADLDGFDMIVVPGGSGGVENLGKSEQLALALQEFMTDDRLVGSICAGPTILAKLGLLDGRKATCYPGCEDVFPAGSYQGVVGVVQDGNLVTASGPGQAVPFGIALLRALCGDGIADRVAADMLL